METGIEYQIIKKTHNCSTRQFIQERFYRIFEAFRGDGGEMVLPGAIWQKMLKVEGADMSVSAVYHDPFLNHRHSS